MESEATNSGIMFLVQAKFSIRIISSVDALTSLSRPEPSIMFRVFEDSLCVDKKFWIDLIPSSGKACPSVGS